MRRVQSNTLDVGIDVHLKNWSTAILSKHSVLRRFLQVDCEGPTLISYIVAKHLAVIVKTCSDICFTIGQKNCQMFVAKLHKFHHPHNRMRFYPAHSVLSFPDFAVDTFLPQRFLR